VSRRKRLGVAFAVWKHGRVVAQRRAMQHNDGRFADFGGSAVIRRPRPTPPNELSTALEQLDEGYVQLLTLLDRRTAFKSIVALLPDAVGFDVAFVGELQDDDTLALTMPTRFRTSALDGLILPAGIGLGGKALLSRRPEWVTNYTVAADLRSPFVKQADLEGLKGMVAVPIADGRRVYGVLYGSDRSEARYGDKEIASLASHATRAARAAIVADRARHSAEVAVHEERTRIGLQLHDTVGAMLFTIGAGMQKLTDAVQDNPELKAQVEMIQRQTIEASDVLRDSMRAYEASPEVIALPIALRADCRAFEDRTGTRARLVVLEELPMMHQSRAKALADSVREALLNVEKHAQATSVLVTVFCDGEAVTAVVADDGHGLRDCKDSKPGLGLVASADRLGRLGGRLTVENNDDGGVTVRAQVPV
jgi:LuxR family transcriptional regulator, regulator of acetate metabolism